MVKKIIIDAYNDSFQDLFDYEITDDFNSLGRKLLTKSGFVTFSSWVSFSPHLNVFKIYDFNYHILCTTNCIFTIDENRNITNEIKFFSSEEEFFQNSLVNNHYNITFDDLQLFKCYSTLVLKISTNIYNEMHKRYFG